MLAAIAPTRAEPARTQPVAAMAATAHERAPVMRATPVSGRPSGSSEGEPVNSETTASLTSAPYPTGPADRPRGRSGR